MARQMMREGCDSEKDQMIQIAELFCAKKHKVRTKPWKIYFKKLDYTVKDNDELYTIESRSQINKNDNQLW